MNSDRLRDTAFLLVIIVASVYLFERIFSVLAFFASPLLLFSISWLLSLVLQPMVHQVVQIEFNLAPSVQRFFRIKNNVWQMPAFLAAPLVFVAVIALVAVVFIALLPALGPQLSTLGETLSNAGPTLTLWVQGLETRLRNIGFRGNLNSIVQPDAISQQITALGASFVQQSIGIASGVANGLFNVFLVLILSFYITLDGQRIGEQVIEIIPLSVRDETRMFFEMVDRVFGGFLRAQLLQSLVYGCATAICMALFGIPDIALASVLSAILIIIPLIGALFALLPPVLIVLLEAPDKTLWLILLLFVTQQILFNMIMPRLLGRSVGLHPLLVFAAMLFGATVAGPWGLIFGIPIAGVAASLLQFLYQRSNQRLTSSASSGKST